MPSEISFNKKKHKSDILRVNEANAICGAGQRIVFPAVKSRQEEITCKR